MRILYVEDDADSAAAIRRFLEGSGHEVTVAPTAKIARSLCVERDFDLWILDIRLPDGHGGELLRFLRRLSDTRAIALTGCGTANDVAEGAEDGFDEYVVKPADFDKLLGAVERCTSSSLRNPANYSPETIHVPRTVDC